MPHFNLVDNLSLPRSNTFSLLGRNDSDEEKQPTLYQSKGIILPNLTRKHQTNLTKLAGDKHLLCCTVSDEEMKRGKRKLTGENPNSCLGRLSEFKLESFAVMKEVHS